MRNLKIDLWLKIQTVQFLTVVLSPLCALSLIAWYRWRCEKKDFQKIVYCEQKPLLQAILASVICIVESWLFT